MIRSILFAKLLGTALLVFSAQGALANHGGSVNQLTPEERAAGWQLLFDGESLAGWSNYGAEPGAPVRGWIVEDGALKMHRELSALGYILQVANPFSSTLDLVTEGVFGDFELSLEWKVSPGGNSGVFYLVPQNAPPPPWKWALEMQVLDNAGHRDGKIDKRRAGDLYDLKAGQGAELRPVGKWNTARIRVEGDRVSHWLNGVKILEIQRAGAEWESMLADSKFRATENFGQAQRGHIVLQDHGDTVWYRNIKLRALDDTAH